MVSARMRDLTTWMAVPSPTTAASKEWASILVSRTISRPPVM